MKQNEIKVLKVVPGEHPKEVVLENSLDALQKAVSIGCDYQGLIEVINEGLTRARRQGKWQGWRLRLLAAGSARGRLWSGQKPVFASLYWEFWLT